MKHVRDTARRIASLILLGPAPDANYDVVTSGTASWPPSAAACEPDLTAP